MELKKNNAKPKTKKMSSLLTCSLLILSAISPASNAFAESQNRPDNIQNKKDSDTLSSPTTSTSIKKEENRTASTGLNIKDESSGKSLTPNGEDLYSSKLIKVKDSTTVPKDSLKNNIEAQERAASFEGVWGTYPIVLQDDEIMTIGSGTIGDRARMQKAFNINVVKKLFLQVKRYYQMIVLTYSKVFPVALALKDWKILVLLTLLTCKVCLMNVPL